MRELYSVSTFFRKLGSTILLRRDKRLFQTCSTKPKSPFFRYTSGCWLYNEQLQFERRYIEFNIPGLTQIAGQILDTQCTKIVKLPEGLYNKVFSLKMENGEEILARIPNPNAGHAKSLVASEVATLDFLRNVLDFPAPRVLGWSSPTIQPNPVGAEYILMEKMKGRQLSEVWDTMSEAQRLDLVKSLVAIEKKLASTKFEHHGSLYYQDTAADGRSITNSEIIKSGQEAVSKFVIGKKAHQYFSAVVQREIAMIRKFESQKPLNPSIFLGITSTSSKNHIQLLERFLAKLPHILPSEGVSHPIFLHHDLHFDNIFVDELDPTKISSIIDWQAVYASPVFMQARFPLIIDCDGPYTWGAIIPKLPQDFDTLPQNEKEIADDRLKGLRLKKFYELASRKVNPLLIKAMDAMRNEDDPTTFIFPIVEQASTFGPVPLREHLIQIYEKWDQIMKHRGLEIQCPISFSREEIDAPRQQLKAWAEAFNEYEGLRSQLLGREGWVSHEEYEEAMRQWESNKATLEVLRERLVKLS
ncbi:hypothetical protein FQN57_000967 [Myotisia sp. PD_48]|nr:hypothetical protein FQN57_000967 [Myotisia sp. PD_48]